MFRSRLGYNPTFYGIADLNNSNRLARHTGGRFRQIQSFFSRKSRNYERQS